MTLRVFLVDDEPPARVRMRQLLGDVGDVLVVGEAADAVEAQAAIAASRPDVVFVDIEMPQISGMSLAGSLPEPRPLIVFATAYDHYALDAFAVEATDYLVKPITRARLAGTLARVRERLSRRTELERELVAASVAQAALVPRAMPHMPGFEAAALTLPARGVGGDFLVAQQVDADRFVLALGDVAGKGLPAGLVASSLQARMEAMARHAAGTAGDVIADVNRTLCRTSDGARFATLAYLDINARSAEVTIVNAGHPPVLLFADDGPLRQVEATGPALGLLPHAEFPSHDVTLDPGAMLFLYSDGVSEACNTSDEEFGTPRLTEIIAQHASESPEVLCQAVVDAVKRHAPGPAGDDITVLVLRRTCGASSFER